MFPYAYRCRQFHHDTLCKQPIGAVATWLIAAMIAGVTAGVLPSQARGQFEVQPAKPEAVDPAQSLDMNARIAWNREWSIYASRYTKIGDEYYACASYDPGYPSSSHVTPQALVQRNARTRTIRIVGNMSRDIKETPSIVDAQAAAPALPSLDFGAYGHVHSVQIVQVTGPHEMLVKQIWLIDAEKVKVQMDKLQGKDNNNNNNNNNRNSDNRQKLKDEIENNFQFRMQLIDHQHKQRDFRSQGVMLLGFDTAGLKPDQRWLGPDGQGLDIAIAGPKTIAYSRSGTGRPRDIKVVVAVPVSEFKGRLSRDEFIKMLATRDLTLKQFVDITIEEKKNDSETAVFNTIKRVEENRSQNTTAEDDSGKATKDKSEKSKRTRASRSAKTKSQKHQKADDDKTASDNSDPKPQQDENND